MKKPHWWTIRPAVMPDFTPIIVIPEEERQWRKYDAQD